MQERSPPYIYGLSSIVARFLNFLLVPLYTSKFVFEPAEYGVVTALYSWTALLNVVLTFGMETAFFRFSVKTNTSLSDPKGDVLFSTATYGLLYDEEAEALLRGACYSLPELPEVGGAPAVASRRTR